MKKTSTVYSGAYLKTEISKMLQFKSQMKLMSRDEESNHLPQDVVSSWFSSEVYYTATINDRPTKQELKWMGNAQIIH